MLKVVVSAVSQEKEIIQIRSKIVLTNHWHNHLGKKSDGIYEKLPELINKFSKVAGQRSAYKNLLYFHWQQ